MSAGDSKLPPPAAQSSAATRLSRLHLLHVSLLHLLRLALMPPLHFLRPRLIIRLSHRLLVLVVLSLLELLPIPVLLRDHIVLLFLVFLVQL